MLFEFLTLLGAGAFLTKKAVTETKADRESAVLYRASNSFRQQHFDQLFYDQCEADVQDPSMYVDIWNRIENYKRIRGFFYLARVRNFYEEMGIKVTWFDTIGWRKTVGVERMYYNMKPGYVYRVWVPQLLMESYDKPSMNYINGVISLADKDRRKSMRMGFLMTQQQALDKLASFLASARGEDHDAIVYFIGGYEFNPDIPEQVSSVYRIITENCIELNQGKSYHEPSAEKLAPLYKAETLKEYEEFLRETGRERDEIIYLSTAERTQRIELSAMKNGMLYCPSSKTFDYLLIHIARISCLP